MYDIFTVNEICQDVSVMVYCQELFVHIKDLFINLIGLRYA